MVLKISRNDNNMKLIKDLNKYKEEVEQIYAFAFNDTHIEMLSIIKMLDLSCAYGYINEKNILVSMICPVERILHMPDETQYKIVNLTCLATAKEFVGHHYGLELIQEVADILVSEYDSVVWQTEHWDIYKDFDLIECTNKVECEYIQGMYPTPMLIIWDQPNADLIIEIEKSTENGFLGIEQSKLEIEAMIEMYQKSGLKYLANPSAYIWYHPETKAIEHLQYCSLAHLTWLMHNIQPTGTFNLFKENDIEQFRCLKSNAKEIQITKTYKPSKKHFKNIKLNDFLI